MKTITRLQKKKSSLNTFANKNYAEWYQSGAEYFLMLEKLIGTAKHELHLQTYILSSDITGTKIVDALIAAAMRGVSIFLFVDAYGSQKMSPAMIGKIKEAGINFKKYGELYSRGRFHIGRRMHHKITVIDGVTSIVGGINISDNYNDVNGIKAWLDFAVVLKGEVSNRLLQICRKRWEGGKFYSPAEKKFSSIPSQKISDAHRLHASSNAEIRIRRNDFIRNKREITISYRQAFVRSKKSITIVGGYFLPGGQSRRLMKKAVKKNVKISVIVAEHSDVPLLISARKYLYSWLLRNGIDVYEYKYANVHGKVLISDGRWTTIGSYDLNNLSSFSNIELNVDIADSDFSTGLCSRLNEIMKNESTLITQESISKSFSLWRKFVMWLSYRLVKTLFVLSFLLAGKREKEF